MVALACSARPLGRAWIVTGPVARRNSPMHSCNSLANDPQHRICAEVVRSLPRNALLSAWRGSPIQAASAIAGQFELLHSGWCAYAMNSNSGDSMKSIFPTLTDVVFNRTFTHGAVLLAALAVSFEASAQGSSLPYGGGGPINAPAIIREYNASGRQMRIEGSCQSSCTTFLAIKNVCIDPSAQLRFHAALFPHERGQKPPPARQARMLAAYNSKLRNYLVTGGHVETFEFHTISGQDMITKFGYRACK
jgi:hypothetical protein